VRWQAFRRAVALGQSQASPVFASNSLRPWSSGAQAADPSAAGAVTSTALPPGAAPALSVPTAPLQAAITPAVCAALQRDGYAVRA